MPTFAKLTGAICFMALFFIVSLMVEPLFAPHAPPKYFFEINVVFAAIVGWRVAGGRAGLGLISGLSNGITAMVAAVAVMLLAHGFVEMIDRSLDKRYDGATEALVAGLGISMDFAVKLASTQIIGLLLAGAMASAVLAEVIAQKVD